MKPLTQADLDPVLLKNMEEAGIDAALSLSILNNYNRGLYEAHTNEREFHIPELSGDRFFDRRGRDLAVRVDKRQAAARFRELELDAEPARFAAGTEGACLLFGRRELEALGEALLPYAAYGILNGGSASSYVDPKKNRALSESVFSFYESEFSLLSGLYEGKPKGITSAFQHPDGTPGPSFMELKTRALLLDAYRYKRRRGEKPSAFIPLFQMTSVLNDGEIAAACREYAGSPLLKELIDATGFSFTDIRTGIQPLLAAFTSAADGPKKRIFSNTNGMDHTPLAMPGGHGQNFLVLRDVYRGLFARGIRFACIGNVDNLGYTLDPIALALVALQRADAAFEFSFRTPIDVKGGILVENRHRRLDCRDLGAAVSFKDMLSAERAGKKILFNCAIGLFNLDSLTRHLDRIITGLPVRVSEQDKKAGRYAQAEQITWEVLGLLERPIVLGVDKYERFLAVKLLIEGLMTSGLRLDDPAFPGDGEAARELHTLALGLNAGLEKKLETVYGMKKENGRWRPKPLAEIDAEMQERGEPRF